MHAGGLVREVVYLLSGYARGFQTLEHLSVHGFLESGVLRVYFFLQPLCRCLVYLFYVLREHFPALRLRIRQVKQQQNRNHKSAYYVYLIHLLTRRILPLLIYVPARTRTADWKHKKEEVVEGSGARIGGLFYDGRLEFDGESYISAFQGLGEQIVAPGRVD